MIPAHRRLEPSPLPDSNRRPLPYHGGAAATQESEIPCTDPGYQGAARGAAGPNRQAPGTHSVRTEVVYFVAVEGCALVKVGRTTKPRLRRRLADLYYANGAPTTVLRTVECPPGTEAALHEAFAAARHHGEWFALTPRLLKLIHAASDERIRRFNAGYRELLEDEAAFPTDPPAGINRALLYCLTCEIEWAAVGIGATIATFEPIRRHARCPECSQPGTGWEVLA